MTILWEAVFLSGLICTTSKNIYLNEKNNCDGNEENVGSLLLELKKIQQEIGNLQTDVTLLSKIHQEVDELRRGFKEMKDLLTNLNLTRFKLSTDCKELYDNGNTKSGVYEINLSGIERKINVYCDMVTEGGGWTAIQKRVSGSVRFNRTWAEYKTGFGGPYDSYWIGNDVIHQLTKGRNSVLYVSITLTNGKKLYELYNQFSVDDESDNYRLLLGGPATGSLGDALLDTGNFNFALSGMWFSTLDRDHDRSGYGNCAVRHGGGGGWWYNSCYSANLNGPWSPEFWDCPWWPTVKNSGEIQETLMMIKPH